MGNRCSSISNNDDVKAVDESFRTEAEMSTTSGAHQGQCEAELSTVKPSSARCSTIVVGLRATYGDVASDKQQGRREADSPRTTPPSSRQGSIVSNPLSPEMPRPAAAAAGGGRSPGSAPSRSPLKLTGSAFTSTVSPLTTPASTPLNVAHRRRLSAAGSNDGSPSRPITPFGSASGRRMSFAFPEFSVDDADGIKRAEGGSSGTAPRVGFRHHTLVLGDSHPDVRARSPFRTALMVHPDASADASPQGILTRGAEKDRATVSSSLA